MTPQTKNPVQTCAGQPSWLLASNRVEAAVTCQGGHLGPVTFHTTAGPIQPYAVAPWGGEQLSSDTADVLRMLRGDFFCAPFGNNTTAWKREKHPPHGETACRAWTLRRVSSDQGSAELVAEIRPQRRPGRVTKHILLRANETNVYCRHELHGLAGPMCLGHHAMLQFPDEPGAGRIALSRWGHGRVCPLPFENPALGGYQALRTGAAFRSLHRVPLAAGGTTDLARYPARDGFEDLVMVSALPPRNHRHPLAWTTVTFPRQKYVWFALKDPRVLASTVLWHSNGGRHYPPWSGRHRRVLGLEEVTSYFHLGLAESAAPNPLSRAGIPTVVHLRPNHPLVVNYVMGVAALPAGFDVVRQILFRPDHIVLRSASGRSIEHPVDLTFLPPTDMKRSIINRAYAYANACFASHGWALPPNAKWDITDFGLGDFAYYGLTLINLAEEPEYCEKLMYARRGQTTPCHTHAKKKEDIICRTGELTLELSPTKPVAGAAPSDSFTVRVNGSPRTLRRQDRLVLPAGSRVTLLPGMWHAFYPTSDECIIGEVSTANDDQNDNIFLDPMIGRFPGVEEDEPAAIRLVSDRT